MPSFDMTLFFIGFHNYSLKSLPVSKKCCFTEEWTIDINFDSEPKSSEELKKA